MQLAIRNKFSVLAFALLASLVALPAAAAAPAAVDVSAVVTAIHGALVPIGLIGVAVLSVMVGIKVYKWVRRAM